MPEESRSELRRSLAKAGEREGHAFRGNQHTGGIPGAGGTAPSGRRRAAAEPAGVRRAFRNVEQNPDGFTLRPGAGTPVTSGYVVALDNALSQVVPAAEFRKNGREIVRKYLLKVRSAARSNPKVMFGGWFDRDNGVYVLDHVEVFPNNAVGRKNALRAGVERDQRSIFHLDTMEEIDTGGTGGYSERTDKRDGTGDGVRSRVAGYDGRGDRRSGRSALRAAAGQRGLRAKLSKAGEREGHAFRGNQYTGGKPGMGRSAVPTQATPGGASGYRKSRLHNLTQTLERPPVGKIVTPRQKQLVKPGKLFKPRSRSDAEQAAREAVAQAAQGKEASISSDGDMRDEMQALMSAVADQTRKMAESGIHGDIDLGKIHFPGTNLFTQKNQGIVRKLMPQFTGKAVPGSPASRLPKREGGEVDVTQHYLKYLHDQGIGVKPRTVSSGALKATQMDLVGDKVVGIAKAMLGGKKFPDRIFVSSDGYIVDGHHRWAAGIMAGYAEGRDLPINVWVVDMPIQQLVQHAKWFSEQIGVEPKTVRVSKYMADLMDRDRVEFLAKRAAVEKGEKSGHPFRGNQHVRVYPAGWSGRYEDLHSEQRAEISRRLKELGVDYGQCVERGYAMLERSKEIPAKRDGKAMTAWEAGRGWYKRAGQMLKEIAKKTGWSDDKFIAALAVTSSNNLWQNDDGGYPNLEVATRIARLMKNKESISVTITEEDVSFWTGQTSRYMRGSVPGREKYLDESGKAWTRKFANKGKLSSGEIKAGTFKASELSAGVLARVLNQSAVYTKPGGTPVKGAGLLSGIGSITGWANVEKAIRIFDGEPIDTAMSGKKIRSFYNNLISEGEAPGTVVDRWVLAALTGRKSGVKTKAKGVKVVQDTLDKVQPRTRKSKLGAAHKHADEWVKDAGTYPFFDTAVVDITDRWNSAHPDEQLSRSDVQAIIWYGAMSAERPGWNPKKRTTRRRKRATVRKALVSIYGGADVASDEEVSWMDMDEFCVPPSEAAMIYKTPLFKGEGSGHPFRGNQHTGGKPGMGGSTKRSSLRSRMASGHSATMVRAGGYDEKRKQWDHKNAVALNRARVDRALADARNRRKQQEADGTFPEAEIKRRLLAAGMPKGSKAYVAGKKITLNSESGNSPASDLAASQSGNRKILESHSDLYDRGTPLTTAETQRMNEAVRRNKAKRQKEVGAERERQRQERIKDLTPDQIKNLYEQDAATKRRLSEEVLTADGWVHMSTLDRKPAGVRESDWQRARSSSRLANKSRSSARLTRLNRQLAAESLGPNRTITDEQFQRMSDRNERKSKHRGGAWRLTEMTRSMRAGMRGSAKLTTAHRSLGGETAHEEKLRRDAERISRKNYLKGRKKPSGLMPEDFDGLHKRESMLKFDDEKRLVFGWAYQALTKSGALAVDRQGDFFDSPEELESTAYDFVLTSRSGDEQHLSVPVADMVESVVFTPEKIAKMGLPEGSVPPLAWWIGFKVQDDRVWNKVRSGDYTGFSLGGSGVREPVSGEEAELVKRSFVRRNLLP